MDYREWETHARGVYPHTEYLARGNSKGEAREGRGQEGDSPKQGLPSAKVLTSEVPESRESRYHRLN